MLNPTDPARVRQASAVTPLANSPADDFEAALKAAMPNVTVLPHPSANTPNHRWIDVAWDRFMISALAPSTTYGQGYSLCTLAHNGDLEPRNFNDAASLIAAIKAYIEAVSPSQATTSAR